jgi:hypothetical protein
VPGVQLTSFLRALALHAEFRWHRFARILPTGSLGIGRWLLWWGRMRVELNLQLVTIEQARNIRTVIARGQVSQAVTSGPERSAPCYRAR